MSQKANYHYSDKINENKIEIEEVGSKILYLSKSVVAQSILEIFLFSLARIYGSVALLERLKVEKFLHCLRLLTT